MDGSVTQTPSVFTDVTINVACGRIITATAGQAAGAGFDFNVNNTAVDADSVILANIDYYSGAYIVNGFPSLMVSINGKGSFKLAILNTGTNAFNGTFTIGFQCL